MAGEEATYPSLVDVAWSSALTVQPVAEVKSAGGISTATLSSVATAREVVGVEAHDGPENIVRIFSPELRA